MNPISLVDRLFMVAIFNSFFFIFFASYQIWILGNASKYWDKRQRKTFEQYLKSEAYALIAFLELLALNFVLIYVVH